jgi:plastocyanin
MRKQISRIGPLAVLLVLAFGITSCGGGGDTTGEEGSASAEEGTTTAEGEGELEKAPEESAPPPSGNAPRAERVEIANFAYRPDPVTIQEGGKVIWINQESAPHTATADDGSFDTGELQEGKLKSETFKEAGEYTYHCSIHPQMHGTVRVVPAE